MAYEISIWLLPLLIAMTFHEAAHRFVAHLLGDDTGRALRGAGAEFVRIIVDSNAVAKRCFVLFAVEASAFLGIVVLLTQACCAVGYP
jgi:hypothetical protein